MKQNQLRVKEGRTELVAPHQNRDLTFLHPSYGPNTYAHVKQEIEQDNLKPATMAETASLVHAAFNSDDKYGQEIKKIMKDRYFWGFTKSLYVPKGAYTYPDLNGEDLDESDLIKKLESNDSSVRFVPFGYKTGEMSSLELAKNPYVIALAGGEEGAEKLAEIADKHKQKPRLFSYDSVSEPLTRVSALGSGWSLGSRLYVNGDSRGYDGYGSAFGVQVAPQARAEK